MSGPKRKRLVERLWKHIDRSAGEGKCWPWTGATNGRYGTVAEGGDGTGISPLYAHRAVYAVKRGIKPRKIPAGKEVRHKCHNPLCCNPAHLRLGSSKRNKRDAIEAGRMHWQNTTRDAGGRFERQRGY